MSIYNMNNLISTIWIKEIYSITKRFRNSNNKNRLQSNWSTLSHLKKLPYDNHHLSSVPHFFKTDLINWHKYDSFTCVWKLYGLVRSRYNTKVTRCGSLLFNYKISLISHGCHCTGPLSEAWIQGLLKFELF